MFLIDGILCSRTDVWNHLYTRPESRSLLQVHPTKEGVLLLGRLLHFGMRHSSHYSTFNIVVTGFTGLSIDAWWAADRSWHLLTVVRAYVVCGQSTTEGGLHLTQFIIIMQLNCLSLLISINWNWGDYMSTWWSESWHPWLSQSWFGRLMELVGK